MQSQRQQGEKSLIILPRQALAPDLKEEDLNREEKAEIIQTLQEKANKANIALVTDFRGLKVETMEELRGKLREKNIDFQVVKNTLAKIALKDSAHETITDHFKDCCAIAFGYDDPVVAAKVLTEFAKKNKTFQIRFGSYQGQVLDADKINELSQLPGREELIAKFLMTCNTVPTNFVALFSNLQRKLLYAMNGIKEQKENQG